MSNPSCCNTELNSLHSKWLFVCTVSTVFIVYMLQPQLVPRFTALWFLKRSENVCPPLTMRKLTNEGEESGFRWWCWSWRCDTSLFWSGCLEKLVIMLFRSVLKCITTTVVSSYRVCFLPHWLFYFLTRAFQLMFPCQSLPAWTVTSRDRTTN